jgi:hypothetical protein
MEAIESFAWVVCEGKLLLLTTINGAVAALSPPILLI